MKKRFFVAIFAIFSLCLFSCEDSNWNEDFFDDYTVLGEGGEYSGSTKKSFTLSADAEILFAFSAQQKYYWAVYVGGVDCSVTISRSKTGTRDVIDSFYTEDTPSSKVFYTDDVGRTIYVKIQNTGSYEATNASIAVAWASGSSVHPSPSEISESDVFLRAN